MKFTKMQGIGNDYLYINLFEENVMHEPELARAMSDRHFGVGSDGIVLIGPSDNGADFRMTMYNADGSRGQMCGNATRCVAKYVYDRGMTNKTEIRLQTDGGIKILYLTLKNGKVETVRVDMGSPITECSQVPCTLGSGVVLAAPVQALDRTFMVTPVNTGNPHGVIVLEEPVEDFDLMRYGPVLERHPVFPVKANIEFINVLAPDHLRMRVWERGSGITLACGTGSCAALTACRLQGLCDRKVRITLDGGELVDEWDEESNHIFMTGPAAFVFEGVYHPFWEQ